MNRSFRRAVRAPAVITAGVVAGLLPLAPLYPQASIEAVFVALRAQDLRLAGIGYRLVTANVPLCTHLVPVTGLQLHALGQYDATVRDAARRFFDFATPVAVEGVVPGSPAAAAGLAAGDSILAVDGAALVPAPADAANPMVEVLAAEAAIAAAAGDGAVTFAVRRAGRPLSLTVRPIRACATRFEVTVGDSYDARADGATVQLSTKLMEGVAGDDELAFVIGHEFAHNVLRHRARLEAAGVGRGMFEGFGASVGYIRRSEIEADMLGLALAANAGFDPAAPARFWRWFGPAHFDSILLARTHPRWSLRVKLLDREAAALRATSVRPYVPPILVQRDRPLDRDWQGLVAGL